MFTPLAFEVLTGPLLASVVCVAFAVAFLLAIVCDLLVLRGRHFGGSGTYGDKPQARSSRRVHRHSASCFPTTHQGALVVAVCCTCAAVIGYAIGAAATALWGIV